MRITGPIDPFFSTFIVPTVSSPLPSVAAPVPPVVRPPDIGAGPAGVRLVSAGPTKIQVLKVVREVTGLGLKESLELVEGAPRVVKGGLSADAAEPATSGTR